MAESSLTSTPRPDTSSAVEPAAVTQPEEVKAAPAIPDTPARAVKKTTPDRKKEPEKRVQKPAPKPPPPTRAAAQSTTPSRPQPTTQSVAVPTPQVVPPRVQESTPRIVVNPPPAPPPVTTPDPTPEPRPAPREEITATVAAYARAIESRDLGAVRRIYPGLTSDQARGFEQFFQAARSINVTFRVTDVETNGNNADARLVGTYQYTSTDGKSQTQPVSFSASLRYDGSSWRLSSVR